MPRLKKWLPWAGLLGTAVFYHSQKLRQIARKTDRLTYQGLDDLNAAQPTINAACHFIEVGDIFLHTLVAGPEDGPLAVLLHGFPEHWLSWKKQVPALAAAGYRVIAPDQRGYNRSDKPSGIWPYRIDALTGDVANLINAFGRKTAVVVGHDWGGGVAWQFASDYPHMVDKLIVMNAPHPQAMRRELARSWEQRLKSWYILFFQLPWLPELFFTLDPLRTARRSFQQMPAAPNAFSEREVEMLAVAMTQPGAMTGMINWYRALRYPAATRTAFVNVPTLLIWGEQDFALIKSLACDLDAWIPKLERYFVPGSGHWVQNEAPDAVNRAMLTFLQSN